MEVHSRTRASGIEASDMGGVLRDYYEKLEKKALEKTNELLLLQRINNMLNSGAGQEKVFREITHGLTSIFGYKASAIHLLSEDGKYLEVKSYSADQKLVRKVERLVGVSAIEYRIPLFEGSCFSELIRSKKPAISDDMVEFTKDHTDEKRLRALAEPIVKLGGMKWGIGVPLLAGEKILGVLGVASTERLTYKDVERLSNLGAQVGLAIEKARMYEDLEREVEKRTQELKRSGEKYRTLIEAMNEGLWKVDRDGTTVFINKRMEEILGRRFKEVVGKQIFDFFDGKNRKTLKEKIRESSRGDPSIIETTLQRKDGKSVPLLVSIAPLKDEMGKVFGNFAVFTNMTELKKLERQLLQSEKLATIGELAAGIAHEINNPLWNIMLYAKLLKKGMVKKQPNVEDVEVIIDQVGMASKIVKDLLEFAREYEPSISVVDINETLNKAISPIEMQLVNEGIEIERKMAPENPKINADRSRLQQVFLNIITNAYHAMPGGGKLCLSTALKDGKVEVCISDTGHGIAKEHMDKLFDPFFTTKEVGEGTGLGLSVSYGIVRAHGGKIEVKSEVGIGSEFKIILPMG